MRYGAITKARRETRVRRLARHNGLALRKSRISTPTIDNHGGYAVVDERLHAFIAGSRFDLSLDEVEAFYESPQHDSDIATMAQGLGWVDNPFIQQPRQPIKEGT